MEKVMRLYAMLPFLFLLLQVAALSPTERGKINLNMFKRCPMEGSAKSRCNRELNRLKNRWQKEPGVADINPQITLAALLEPGDDEFRWSAGDAAEVTGFVASVEDSTGGESCNCGGDSTGAKDIHINLVLDPSVAAAGDHECRRVIVEVTPRWQFLKGWSFNQIRNEIEGKRVSFRGWMLFDRVHIREALNTQNSRSPSCGGRNGVFRCGGPVNKRIWRATAWEIHPVTGYTVL